MGTTTVLVAEDDDLIRNIFVEIIKGESFNVIQAADGQKALNLIADNRVDMVITDIKMPLMNGLDLLAAIKREHPKLPVIVITGFNSEYSEQDALAAGADAYLTKPFKVADVAVMLRSMYQRTVAPAPGVR